MEVRGRKFYNQGTDLRFNRNLSVLFEDELMTNLEACSVIFIFIYVVYISIVCLIFVFFFCVGCRAGGRDYRWKWIIDKTSVNV